jgi:multimeric flavodoxin WrbA
MLKVIGICGSPREISGTEHVLNLALDTIDKYKEIEVELITLSDKKIKRCTGCCKCNDWKGALPNYCIQHDDVGGIIDKVLNADGCIIASPVYLTSVPGILKDFFDRICFALYTPDNNCSFQNKFRVGSAIAVGGVRNGGQETTLSTIHNFLLSFGYLVTSGPCFELGKCETHIGAGIWSKDASIDSIESDSIGLENVKYMATKVAESVLKFC